MSRPEKELEGVLEGTTSLSALPPEVEMVFRDFRTCEFSTLAHDGTPITWPTVTLWQPEEGRFVITASIGLVQKALNVRRNPKVSLLFSEPTASGLQDPPSVLVQGEAEVTEEIKTSPAGFEEYWRRLFERQPVGKMYSANPLMRYLMDWYYMRLYIFVHPRRVSWRSARDPGRSPDEVELTGNTDEAARYLPWFSSAVLSGTDAEGHPCSVRCHPVPGESTRLPRFEFDGADIQPVPASLLCHGHDERLWNLRSFLVRGRLERGEKTWTFDCGKFISGGGVGGPWGAVRAMLGMRRTASAYLKKRGLARPRVPWAEIKALQEREKQ
jgi:hypothetical protein